jgi:hypothetical protein
MTSGGEGMSAMGRKRTFKQAGATVERGCPLWVESGRSSRARRMYQVGKQRRLSYRFALYEEEILGGIVK